MNDTSMNDASRASGISLEHASFAHLSSIEWEALHRLAAVSGDSIIKTLLTAGTEEQQRLAAQEFMVRELADLRQRVSTPTHNKSNKTDIVKLDVSTNSGEGADRLHLNWWFCEVDIAVEARQLSTQLATTHFLLSKLGGAKEWALGKLVANTTFFPTMTSMKSDLRIAFEPPQDETVQRSAFLSLKQGRLSMLEYIQRAHHLVSCVTVKPIDMATQVLVFVSGMKAGYQRFYRTRKTSYTLEEAFTVALREDYSVTASHAFDISRPLAPAVPAPTPMEIDAIQQQYSGRWEPTSFQRSSYSSSTLVSRPMRCFRCR